MLKVESYFAPDKFYLKTEVDNNKYIKKITRREVIHSRCDNEYECFIESTSEPGVYSYGAKQLKDDVFHSAGYVWSSRCSVMNKLFNMCITEVIINGCCYGMDVYLLKELVEEYSGKKFTVTLQVVHDDEISYRLKEVE